MRQIHKHYSLNISCLSNNNYPALHWRCLGASEKRREIVLLSESRKQNHHCPTCLFGKHKQLPFVWLRLPPPLFCGHRPCGHFPKRLSQTQFTEKPNLEELLLQRWRTGKAGAYQPLWYHSKSRELTQQTLRGGTEPTSKRAAGSQGDTISCRDPGAFPGRGP